MPGPTKRTRSSPNPNVTDDETGTLSSTPTPRRSTANNPPPPPPPNARPSLSRSASTTTNSPTPSRGPTHLTRSNSMVAPSTRRTTNSFTGIGQPSSRTVNNGRGGTLLRTQSSSAIPSDQANTNMKNMVAGGSGGVGPKGGNGGEGDGLGGGKRFGKGKENIPPKREEEGGEGASRKRLRVGSRSNGSGRGRSGSVVSVRSESGSARHASLAPSSSSFSELASLRTSRLPSPSPSPSVSTAASFDSTTSADPLDTLMDEEDDLENDHMDIDKTPTKRKIAYRRRVTLPTPPPSSPTKEDEEVGHATKGMGLIRVKSSGSFTSGRRSRSSSQNRDVETISLVLDDTMAVDEIENQQRVLNPYKQLKAYLRLSSTLSQYSDTISPVDQTVVGRDEEKVSIRSYLSSTGGKDVGMYVSGPPGTGKTALVTAFGKEMAGQGWSVVEVGCMGLKVTDMWRRLGEELGCGTSEQDVRRWLEREGAKTLIILDEIDSLLPPPPSLPPPATSHLLSKLFTLPLASSSENIIKLIAISNTLDLTLRARLVLPDGIQPEVLPFKAYGAIEMTSIVAARIERASAGTCTELAKVDSKAVELLCRKVEAQNGDLRMCLGVLGSAINLAEADWLKKTSNAAETALGSETPSIPLVKVSLPHILKALTSHTQQLKASAGTGNTGTSSSTSRKIRSVPLQGKMVLVSVLVFLSRSRAGLPGCPSVGSGLSTPATTPTKSSSSSPSDAALTTTTLFATYTHLLSHHTSPFPPASESDYRDLLSNLETLGLVSLGSFTGPGSMARTLSGSSRLGNKSAPKVELCVRDEEVKDGLGLGMVEGKGMADEEVSKVWEREERKVLRARERVEQAKVAVLLAGEREKERIEDGF